MSDPVRRRQSYHAPEGGALIIPFPLSPDPRPPRRTRLGRGDRARLAALRQIAAIARDASAPAPGPGAVVGMRAALALFGCLDAVSARRLDFASGRAPGTADERWLLRLLATLRAGDIETAQILVRFRIPPPHESSVLALAAALALRLDRLSTAQAL